MAEDERENAGCMQCSRCYVGGDNAPQAIVEGVNRSYKEIEERY